MYCQWRLGRLVSGMAPYENEFSCLTIKESGEERNRLLDNNFAASDELSTICSVCSSLHNLRFDVLCAVCLHT